MGVGADIDGIAGIASGSHGAIEANDFEKCEDPPVVQGD